MTSKIIFPRSFESRGTKLIYDGQSIETPLMLEEFSWKFSQIKDEVKDETFLKNFWKDFKKICPNNIKDFSKCDFRNFKKLSKIPSSAALHTTLNGHIDPPCIFVGRGKHPLRGKLKHKIKPCDVTVNKAHGTVDNRGWKSIVNDKSSTWVANWQDPITGKLKYLYPSEKSKQDSKKFAKARKLKRNISKIRKTNFLNMTSSKSKTREHAIACYLIDLTCIRVGDPTNKQVDGCITLQKKHISFPKMNYITLDFVGKDSINFNRTFKIHPVVFNLLKKIKSNKIFSHISYESFKDYLNSLFPSLTAKIFRTCNASSLFDRLLQTEGESSTVYKNANKEVAKLCNHLRKNTDLNLNTSKINYLDPRITYAFCKKKNIHIKNVFSPKLCEQTSWALNTESNFRF